MGCKLKKRHHTNLASRTTLLILLSAVLVSCGSKETTVSTSYTNIDYTLRYRLRTQEKIPYYTTLHFTDGQGYEFKNASSNKLLITLDGGGDWYGSRVGVIGGEFEWNQVVNWLLPFYGDYSIFVPEKFHWGRGSNPFLDIKNREKYTFDNLMTNYTGVIGEYLSQNNYETIIIFGHSEGGFIAPELYFLLEEFNISALITNGAGGLASFVDIATVRRGEPLEDESIYIDIYNQYLAAYSGENYAEAPDEQRFRQNGQEFIPTGYWYSYQARRPFDFYKNIDIPVLFIHGLLDMNVSPISTKYVEQNLPDKPFTYIYYPDSIHYPNSERELVRIRADIANWLKEKGL